MQNITKTIISILLAAFFPLLVEAQVAQHFSLKEAAQAAVLKSPEVEARWHAYRETTEEIGVARGGFFPKLDYSAGTGREKIVQSRIGTNIDFNGNDRTLSLRQMLFDGFATSSEVNRLGKAALVRYFELLDASENIALEAGRAYLDVVRYRYHIYLAEENYIQHQAAYEQLKQRAESGVGKRVDVDQAASRLALADVNLTTAYANLHDVTSRYVRIVGVQPAKVMFAPAQLARALPKNVEAALLDALKHNPALRASIENIEAAQYDLEGRRAAFMPKLDLVARRDEFSNYLANGPREDSRVELRMNFNLFNGGSDVARSRQYRERKNITLDQREKACRDMRQTLSIAFNDTLRLNDQLSFIGLQVSLVEKTRTAYRDQFNIGQRTLLDLLNTQNEFFDSRRSQINADVDLSIAYLRSYAGMGRLLETLGLKRIEADKTVDEDNLTLVDLSQLCPATAPLDTTLDREALGRKAKEMMEGSSNNFIGGRGQPAINSLTVNGTATEGVVAKVQPTALEAEITAQTTAWGAAWASRDSKAYLAFYALEFKPEKGLSRDAWVRQREQRLTRASDIRIEIQNLTVLSNSPDTAVAGFRQIYKAGTFVETTDKEVEWRKIGGQWLMVRESTRPLAKGE
ncbi:MAG: TolC family outer membrane protein [Betaproteobacteria bacterium]